MRCPRCGGTGRMRIPGPGGFRSLEGRCPSCAGLGTLSRSQGSGASRGDLLAFALPTGVIWGITGTLATMLVYSVPVVTTAAPSNPTGLPLLVKVAAIWGFLGLAVGVVALFDFVRLSSERGPTFAFPTHFIHMAMVALVIGALLGGQLYGAIEPPPGAILQPIGWRLAVCSVAALVATMVAIRVIPKVPRLFE